MSSARRTEIVVWDDARGVPDTDLTVERFARSQRRQVEAQHVEEVDAGRLLVIDHADALGTAGRQAYFSSLLTSPTVSAVVCVAVGPPSEADEGVIIRRSPMMQPPAMAILWVGDTSGGGWDGGTTRATAFATSRPGAGDELLDVLIDVLKQPGVFDRVLERAELLPDAVGSPGLRVIIGRLDMRTLLPALAGAAESVVGRAEATEGGAVPMTPPPLPLLTGQADPAVLDAAMRIRPDGVFGELQDSCRDALEEIDLLVTGLRNPLAWLTGIAARTSEMSERICEAAAWLSEYRSKLADTFTWVDGSRGLDQPRRDVLERMGVRLHPVPGTSAADIGAALKAEVMQDMARQRPLRSISWRLHSYAQRAAPAGSAVSMPQLAWHCPDELLADLARQPYFPLTRPSGVVLLGGLAACLLAGVGSAGLITAPIAILLWVLLVWAMHAGAPRPSEGTRQSSELTTFLAHALVGVAGGVAGYLIGPSLSLPPQAGALAAAAGIVGVVLTAHVGWTRAVERWRSMLRLGEARVALEGLNKLLTHVMLNEWLLSGPRRRASDGARALARAVDKIADELGVGIRDLLAAGAAGNGGRLPFGAGDSLAQRLHEHGGEIQAVIRDDLMDIVSVVLAPRWSELDRGAGLDLIARLDTVVSETLHTYIDHLERDGIQEAPAFGKQTERRKELVEAVWRATTEVGALLMASEREARFIQLSTPEQLRFLETLSSPILIRFAPRAAQRPITERLRGDSGLDLGRLGEVIWTASGHYSGVIRLTPLRKGSARTAWTNEHSAPDGGDTGD